VEGKIPKAFNPNKRSKSRGSDLGYLSDFLRTALIIASPNGKRKPASKHDSLLKGYPSGTELAFEDSWQGHG
jgi:hypothetical protein